MIEASLTTAYFPEASPSAGSPSSTAAAPENTAETEKELAEASFVCGGIEYLYDPKTGVLTAAEGKEVQLEDALRKALNGWLEEQER